MWTILSRVAKRKMVSRNTVRDTIWNLFYDKIKTDVTSVTLMSNKSVTVKNIFNAWNSSEIKVKSDFPFIILEPPKFTSVQHTFKTSKYTGLMTVTTNTTQKEAAIKLMDAIGESIESYRKTLRYDYGMKFLDIDDEDDGNLDMGPFSGYFQLIRYKFEVILPRWS